MSHPIKNNERELLERVGLKDCIHKKPGQLSGGQMQRAAIARALANDPETFLCEDSTGRDTMELIRKISEDRLVIMVAHNPEAVEKYADRIVRLQDGKIILDSHPLQERPKPDSFHLTKTGMNFTTALSLAFNNIKSKKWRSFLTAVESGAGIISIALIAAMSGRAIENTPALAALTAVSFIAGFGMVAFLTYISVLERKEGIGILKVLGAGNKDISRVFNAETFTIGAFSGILSVGIVKLSGAADLQIPYAVIMIIAGAVLTMLCGYIPARMAVKKNIAEALKSD